MSNLLGMLFAFISGMFASVILIAYFIITRIKDFKKNLIRLFKGRSANEGFTFKETL